MKKYTKAELFEVANFTPKTKADLLKADKAYRLYITAMSNGDSGALGKAVEVLSRRPNSRKATVAKQGKDDMTFRLDGKLYPAERKTNGGRVDNIKLSGYVVYSLNVHNSTADIDISPRIMKADVFLTALYEFNAIKPVKHNGTVDGMAIQPSNRKLWNWLEEQLEFNREWDYYTEDFEG